MSDNPSTQEVEGRARELARRVMNTPPVAQRWPKKPKPSRSGVAKPEKPEPAGEAF